MAIESTLIAAAIGGVAGTTISQVFGLWAGHIQRRHERDVRQRERLERMAQAVADSMQWFEDFPRERPTANTPARVPFPPRSARWASTLADLYFPTLIDPADAFVNSLLDYHHLAVDSLQPGIELSIGQQIVLHLRKHPELQTVAAAAVERRQEHDQAIATQAKKYWHT